MANKSLGAAQSKGIAIYIYSKDSGWENYFKNYGLWQVK